MVDKLMGIFFGTMVVVVILLVIAVIPLAVVGLFRAYKEVFFH